MAVLGNVDSVEGLYVSGWAANSSGGDVCRIEIVDEQGSVVGTGRAARNRPDLTVLNLGRTTFGFRVPVKATTKNSRLKVLANGVVLGGFPVELGPNKFDGYCLIKGDQIEGWVAERSIEGEAPSITAVNKVGRVCASVNSVFDQALSDQFVNRASFCLVLDNVTFVEGRQEIIIEANGIAFAKVISDLSLKSHLEELTTDGGRGWILSPEIPGRIFEVDVILDGVSYQSVENKVPRSDVESTYPGAGNSGFDFSLRSEIDKPTSNVIDFFLKNSHIRLFDGPYVLGSRELAISSLQNLARICLHDNIKLTVTERSLLESALTSYAGNVRMSSGFVVKSAHKNNFESKPGDNFSVLVYIGRELISHHIVEIKDCIDSVLRACGGFTRNIFILNDAIKNNEFTPLLAHYRHRDNVIVVENLESLSRVEFLNAVIALVRGDDLLLVDADIFVFDDAVAEIRRTAYLDQKIATVTAISNDLGIFSYPSLPSIQYSLEDISWPDLAEEASRISHDILDVPSVNCSFMFVKSEIIERIGLLHEGYWHELGEQVEFCARASLIGYRHVAAASVFVERKIAKFGRTKSRTHLDAKLLFKNDNFYSEYKILERFQNEGGLRSISWKFDLVRLSLLKSKGTNFTLEVGSYQSEIEEEFFMSEKINLTSSHKDAPREVINVIVGVGGLIELECRKFSLRSIFLVSEVDQLFKILSEAAVDIVKIRNLAGFSHQFISHLIDFNKGRQSIYFITNFYSTCPRSNLIDAVEVFCGLPELNTCRRCIELSNIDEVARSEYSSPGEHRAIFQKLFDGVSQVVSPSRFTSCLVEKAFPDCRLISIQKSTSGAEYIRRLNNNGQVKVLVLGSLGRCNVTVHLMSIIRSARLSTPQLHFYVFREDKSWDNFHDESNITFLAMDDIKDILSNIEEDTYQFALFPEIQPSLLVGLIEKICAVGILPLVVNYGAMADYVRETKFGGLFSAQFQADDVISMISRFSSNTSEKFLDRSERAER